MNKSFMMADVSSLKC